VRVGRVTVLLQNKVKHNHQQKYSQLEPGSYLEHNFQPGVSCYVKMGDLSPSPNATADASYTYRFGGIRPLA
jgi:hypothetical protein